MCVVIFMNLCCQPFLTKSTSFCLLVSIVKIEGKKKTLQEMFSGRKEIAATKTKNAMNCLLKQAAMRTSSKNHHFIQSPSP